MMLINNKMLSLRIFLLVMLLILPTLQSENILRIPRGKKARVDEEELYKMAEDFTKPKSTPDVFLQQSNISNKNLSKTQKKFLNYMLNYEGITEIFSSEQISNPDAIKKLLETSKDDHHHNHFTNIIAKLFKMSKKTKDQKVEGVSLGDLSVDTNTKKIKELNSKEEVLVGSPYKTYQSNGVLEETTKKESNKPLKVDKNEAKQTPNLANADQVQLQEKEATPPQKEGEQNNIAPQQQKEDQSLPLPKETPEKQQLPLQIDLQIPKKATSENETPIAADSNPNKIEKDQPIQKDFNTLQVKEDFPTQEENKKLVQEEYQEAIGIGPAETSLKEQSQKEITGNRKETAQKETENTIALQKQNEEVKKEVVPKETQVGDKQSIKAVGASEINSNQAQKITAQVKETSLPDEKDPNINQIAKKETQNQIQIQESTGVIEDSQKLHEEKEGIAREDQKNISKTNSQQEIQEMVSQSLDESISYSQSTGQKAKATQKESNTIDVAEKKNELKEILSPKFDDVEEIIGMPKERDLLLEGDKATFSSEEIKKLPGEIPQVDKDATVFEIDKNSATTETEEVQETPKFRERFFGPSRKSSYKKSSHDFDVEKNKMLKHVIENGSDAIDENSYAISDIIEIDYHGDSSSGGLLRHLDQITRHEEVLHKPQYEIEENSSEETVEIVNEPIFTKKIINQDDFIDYPRVAHAHFEALTSKNSEEDKELLVVPLKKKPKFFFEKERMLFQKEQPKLQSPPREEQNNSEFISDESLQNDKETSKNDSDIPDNDANFAKIIPSKPEDVENNPETILPTAEYEKDITKIQFSKTQNVSTEPKKIQENLDAMVEQNMPFEEPKISRKFSANFASSELSDASLAKDDNEKRQEIPPKQDGAIEETDFKPAFIDEQQKPKVELPTDLAQEELVGSPQMDRVKASKMFLENEKTFEEQSRSFDEKEMMSLSADDHKLNKINKDFQEKVVVKEELVDKEMNKSEREEVVYKVKTQVPINESFNKVPKEQSHPNPQTTSKHEENITQTKKKMPKISLNSSEEDSIILPKYAKPVNEIKRVADVKEINVSIAEEFIEEPIVGPEIKVGPTLQTRFNEDTSSPEEIFKKEKPKEKPSKRKDRLFFPVEEESLEIKPTLKAIFMGSNETPKEEDSVFVPKEYTSINSSQENGNSSNGDENKEVATQQQKAEQSISKPGKDLKDIVNKTNKVEKYAHKMDDLKKKHYKQLNVSQKTEDLNKHLPQKVVEDYKIDESKKNLYKELNNSAKIDALKKPEKELQLKVEEPLENENSSSKEFVKHKVVQHEEPRDKNSRKIQEISRKIRLLQRLLRLKGRLNTKDSDTEEIMFKVDKLKRAQKELAKSLRQREEEDAKLEEQKQFQQSKKVGKGYYDFQFYSPDEQIMSHLIQEEEHQEKPKHIEEGFQKDMRPFYDTSTYAFEDIKPKVTIEKFQKNIPEARPKVPKEPEHFQGYDFKINKPNSPKSEEIAIEDELVIEPKSKVRMFFETIKDDIASTDEEETPTIKAGNPEKDFFKEMKFNRYNKKDIPEKLEKKEEIKHDNSQMKSKEDLFYSENSKEHDLEALFNKEKRLKDENRKKIHQILEENLKSKEDIMETGGLNHDFIDTLIPVDSFGESKVSPRMKDDTDSNLSNEAMVQEDVFQLDQVFGESRVPARKLQNDKIAPGMKVIPPKKHNFEELSSTERLKKNSRFDRIFENKRKLEEDSFEYLPRKKISFGKVTKHVLDELQGSEKEANISKFEKNFGIKENQVPQKTINSSKPKQYEFESNYSASSDENASKFDKLFEERNQNIQESRKKIDPSKYKSLDFKAPPRSYSEKNIPNFAKIYDEERYEKDHPKKNNDSSKGPKQQTNEKVEKVSTFPNINEEFELPRRKMYSPKHSFDQLEEKFKRIENVFKLDTLSAEKEQEDAGYLRRKRIHSPKMKDHGLGEALMSKKDENTSKFDQLFQEKGLKDLQYFPRKKVESPKVKNHGFETQMKEKEENVSKFDQFLEEKGPEDLQYFPRKKVESPKVKNHGFVEPQMKGKEENVSKFVAENNEYLQRKRLESLMKNQGLIEAQTKEKEDNVSKFDKSSEEKKPENIQYFPRKRIESPKMKNYDFDEPKMTEKEENISSEFDKMFEERPSSLPTKQNEQHNLKITPAVIDKIFESSEEVGLKKTIKKPKQFVENEERRYIPQRFRVAKFSNPRSMVNNGKQLHHRRPSYFDLDKMAEIEHKTEKELHRRNTSQRKYFEPMSHDDLDQIRKIKRGRKQYLLSSEESNEDIKQKKQVGNNKKFVFVTDNKDKYQFVVKAKPEAVKKSSSKIKIIKDRVPINSRSAENEDDLNRYFSPPINVPRGNRRIMRKKINNQNIKLVPFPADKQIKPRFRDEDHVGNDFKIIKNIGEDTFSL